MGIYRMSLKLAGANRLASPTTDMREASNSACAL